MLLELSRGLGLPFSPVQPSWLEAWVFVPSSVHQQIKGGCLHRSDPG